MAVPLRYYQNNITGTLIMLELMAQYGCKRVRRGEFNASARSLPLQAPTGVYSVGVIPFAPECSSVSDSSCKLIKS